MRQRSRRAIDDHQAAGIASLERMLRDAIGGEIEIVVGGAGAVVAQRPFI